MTPSTPGPAQPECHASPTGTHEASGADTHWCDWCSQAFGIPAPAPEPTCAAEYWLAEIEARCAAATKGPWSRNIRPASQYPVIFAGRNTHVAQVLNRGSLSAEELEANTDFIALARDDVPWLCAQLRTALAPPVDAAAGKSDADELIATYDAKLSQLSGYIQAHQHMNQRVLAEFVVVATMLRQALAASPSVDAGGAREAALDERLVGLKATGWLVGIVDEGESWNATIYRQGERITCNLGHSHGISFTADGATPSEALREAVSKSVPFPARPEVPTDAL